MMDQMSISAAMVKLGQGSGSKTMPVKTWIDTFTGG